MRGGCNSPQFLCFFMLPTELYNLGRICKGARIITISHDETIDGFAIGLHELAVQIDDKHTIHAVWDDQFDALKAGALYVFKNLTPTKKMLGEIISIESVITNFQINMTKKFIFVRLNKDIYKVPRQENSMKTIISFIMAIDI